MAALAPSLVAVSGDLTQRATAEQYRAAARFLEQLPRPRDRVLLRIKHLLYEEKYTIQGARRRLQEMRSSGEIEEERQDVLEPEVLSGMKAELQSLLDILTPSEPDPEP